MTSDCSDAELMTLWADEKLRNAVDPGVSRMHAYVRSIDAVGKTITVDSKVTFCVVLLLALLW